MNIVEPTQADLERIMEQEIGLCYNGYYPKGRKGYSENKEALKRSFRQFQLCVQWLSQCKLRKKINKNYNSDDLKHQVGKWAGEYVSNGAFIAAVIHLGIPWDYSWPFEGWPMSLRIGISQHCPLLYPDRNIQVLDER